MSSGGKRKSASIEDVSVVPVDGTMAPPPFGGSLRRCSSGDLKMADRDEKKRFKPGSPVKERDESEMMGTETDSVVSGDREKQLQRKKKKKKNMKGATNVAVEPSAPAVAGGMDAIYDRLEALLNELKVPTEGCLKIVRLVRECDGIVHGLEKKISRLEGFNEGRQLSVNNQQSTAAVGRAAAPAVAAGSAGVPAASVAGAFPPLVKKPTETWSVVVRGKGKAVPSEEVIEKVRNEVGPTMSDVRVHALKPIRGGGAVIRTRSKAEREKIADNKKFEELGLEVAVGEKLGPRVVVKAVEAGIKPEEFMEQLFEKNFNECMDSDVFKKKVRLVTRSWKAGDGKLDVVLEGSQDAMQHLLNVGRVYINWFGFLVRPQGEVAHCYRCLGFDHLRRNCRVKESVCRICSEAGHEARQCQNSPYCRNCALRGLPASHTLLSPVCPIYAGLVARANARH